MALAAAYPFGIRDIKLTNLAGDTQVDLPAARTLSFSERFITGEMRGDDALKALMAISEAVEWNLESGGIDLDAYAIMTGRTVTATGSTPNQTETMNWGAGDCLPYFKIYGQAYADDCDGDYHVKFYKAKLLSFDGSFSEGEFFVTSCSGVAIDDGVNGIADIVQHETAATLPTS